MNVIAPPDRNEEEPMRNKTFILAIFVCAILAVYGAQGFDTEPVFTVDLVPDRRPVVAGEVLQLAAIVKIEPGWHVNSDEPGDEFSMPTTVKWMVPEGWPEPMTIFPDGDHVEFEFADGPIEVWEGEVVLVGRMTVPETPSGAFARESR